VIHAVCHIVERVLQCNTVGALTIRIPDQLRRELEALSRRKQQPLSQVVRESLSRYVAIERFQNLRKKTLPLAEARGFLTDEDVFKAVS
jgi:predicted transcriptional regulator